MAVLQGTSRHLLFAAMFVSALQNSATTTINTEVDTVSGRVRGFYDANDQVTKFLGVPYAAPPIGPLRFAAPQDPEAWSGVRDARHRGHVCMQTIMPFFQERYDRKNVSAPNEDCLTLNVYVPTSQATDSAEGLPVMFWIHAGAFVVGFGDGDGDGARIARHGLVVVTINYRLDAFGFLSAEDDEMPGNYGMMDQVQALKWVKSNIRGFGGNPDEVTMFGASAGAVSASLLTISPLTEGLFKRVIMESGSGVSTWASHSPGKKIPPLEVTKRIAKGVGCLETTDTLLLLACLRNVEANTLQNVAFAVGGAIYGQIAIAPVVETKFGFLPDDPYKLLTDGKMQPVDTIRGYNSDEVYGMFMDPLFMFSIEMMKDHDKNDVIKNTLEGNLGLDSTKQRDVQKFDNDFGFIYPAVLEMNLVTEIPDSSNKHYLYEFEYRPSYSTKPDGIKAVHLEELPFVFDEIPSFPNASPDDVAMSTQMAERWTNFAKTGNPFVEGGTKWKPYSVAEPRYLKIGKETKETNWEDQTGLELFEETRSKLWSG